MADVITLTENPIRVGYATEQSLDTVVDVLDYDILDLQVEVVGFETPGASPNIVVAIQTGLQRDTTFGWVQVGVTGTLTNPGTSSAFATIHLAGNFLRYVRWFINSWGTQAIATWWIRGLGRSYNET